MIKYKKKEKFCPIPFSQTVYNPNYQKSGRGTLSVRLLDTETQIKTEEFIDRIFYELFVATQLLGTLTSDNADNTTRSRETDFVSAK